MEQKATVEFFVKPEYFFGTPCRHLDNRLASSTYARRLHLGRIVQIENRELCGSNIFFLLIFVGDMVKLETLTWHKFKIHLSRKMSNDHG